MSITTFQMWQKSWSLFHYLFFLNQNKSWTEENKPGDIETSECLDFFFLWSNNFINDTIVNDESKKIVKVNDLVVLLFV
jgi:hypothetical protein